MRDYFYRIEGYSPADHGIARFGFCVSLDRAFARKALETKMPPQGQKNLEALAKSTLQGLFGKDRMIRPPYQFVDDSLLLHYVQVPGDACDMGIDGSKLSSFKEEKDSWQNAIDYTPHNVDSTIQAYSLLSLFLTWAHIAEAFVNPVK